MKESTKGEFSNISELTTAETHIVSGGLTKVSGLATYSSFVSAPLRELKDESVTFKGSTVLSSGGTYDHDEGVCIQDS